MSRILRTTQLGIAALALSAGGMMLLPTFADDNAKETVRKETKTTTTETKKDSTDDKEHKAHIIHSDAMFATCLLIDNKNEVALAEFAQERATNSEAKEFAKQMISDHGDFIKKLGPYALHVHDADFHPLQGVKKVLDRASDRRDTRQETRDERRDERRDAVKERDKSKDTRPEARRENRQERREERREERKTDDSAKTEKKTESKEVKVTTAKKSAEINNEVEKEVREKGDDASDVVNKNPETTKVTIRKDTDKGATAAERHSRAAAAVHNIGFLVLKQELAAECAKSTREELEKQKGDHFDHAYINQQIMAHMHMKDMLTVFRRHATPEFAKLLDAGLETTEKHLGHAKKIAASFHGDSDGSQRKSETKTTTTTKTE